MIEEEVIVEKHDEYLMNAINFTFPKNSDSLEFY